MKKFFSLLTLALLTLSVGADNYVKVTSASDLTSGKYLIVYEDGKVAFNGALNSLDVASNTVAVTINNGVIAPKDAIIAAQFDIDVTAGTIKSASGYYIGQTSDDNGMKTSKTEAYTNTITITDGNADIKSSGNAYLRYNAASNQARFRYYKSSSYTGQKAIQLYKWDGEEDPVMGLVPPVFTPNGGEFSGSIEVSLTCATPNAEIQYYECDPTTHEIDWTTYKYYTQPFYVNETKSFVAYSSKSNEVSEYVYADFIKKATQCAKPKFTPANGTTFMQGEELDVTINCDTEGATIKYALNDGEFQNYSAPIHLTETTTIKAVASAEGNIDSDEATATYTMVVPETTGPIFNLVTDVTTLADGDHIILVNTAEDGTAVAMGAAKTNNFGSVDVVVNGNKVQTEKANIITLVKNGDNWNLKAAEGYLYAASSSSNHLKAEETVDNNGNANAAISIADNAASIVFQGTNSHKYLRYNPNNGSPIFSCYEEGKQNPVYIYKTTEEIITVADPTFDPASKEFEESIDVTINAEEGATIKYALNDGEFQNYSAPIHLTETTTIKAQAFKGEVESNVVTATYTKKEATDAITTLKQANEQKDGTDFTFAGDAVVTAQQGKYLWLRDASGYGLIYGKINGVDTVTFNPGTVLNKNWAAQKTTYNGLLEYKNATNVSASENTNAELAAAQEITALSEDLINAYVVVKNIKGFTIADKDITATFEDGTNMVMYNQFNISDIPTEDGNYTVYGAVGRYAKGTTDQIQLYILNIEGYEPPAPQYVDVNNFAEAYALESGTKVKMLNDAVVTYQNGSRLFVRDTEGTSGLIYGSLGKTFENGQVLGDEWTATYKLFNDNTHEFEILNAEEIFASGETRNAAPVECTSISANIVNEYVILKGVTLQADTTANIFYTANNIQICNFFNGVKIPEVKENSTYDVTGIVMLSKAGQVRVYVTEMTEVSSQTLVGDVDEDGNVNITDVTALIDMLLSDNTMPSGDVNGDGQINITDVTDLIDILLKN